MEIFPCRQVKGAIEQNHPTYSLSLGTNQQVPVISVFRDERVAEMDACTSPQFNWRAVNHRITRVVLPGQQIITTGCQADDLGMHPAVQQRRGTVIVDGAPSPATLSVGSLRGRSQGDGQVGPMNQ